MQGNGFNYPYQMYPQQPIQPVGQPVNAVPNLGANAVNINIVSPQAFASGPVTNPYNTQNFYPVYGPNANPNMPSYPQNYNNLMQQPPSNAMQAYNDAPIAPEKTFGDVAQDDSNVSETGKKKQKMKKITPLTDNYIMSLENYLNNDNPKIRLIGAKELLERFKEDDNRKDNPSLIPLLNKALKDPNSAVRFLALTTLQLEYSVGNEETVQILKDIQANSQDKFAEDALLASEALLKLSGGEKYEIPDNSPDKKEKKDKEEE